MLFKDTIVAIKGLNAPSTGTFVLNTNRLGLYKVRATTKSDYYYTLNPWDRRSKPLFIHSGSAVATLASALDTALNSNVMTLKVYPNDDTTQSTVSKYINYDDFAYAYAYEGDSTKSWVFYTSKAFKMHRVLVDNALDALIDLAATGTTTTTTTTTTTSTTTTSTTT